MKLEFSRYIFEKKKSQDTKKIHRVKAGLFQAGRRKDTTKLTVAFRNFANAPKNSR